MSGPGNVPEKYRLINEAARNSSEATLEGVATSTHTDGFQLTWQVSGNPQLGQATFGLITPSSVFNAKFDGTEPISLSVSDFATSKSRYVDLDYSYGVDKFSVFIPHGVLDLDGVEVKFEFAVNSVRRGEVTLVV